MELRDYQVLAINAIEEEHERVRGTLLVLPTGTGKTIVFAKYIERFLRKNGGAALILSHRGHLLRQAHEKLLKATSIDRMEIALEKGDSYAEFDGFFDPKVILASKDSLHPKRLKRFDPKRISLVVIDEAHRMVADTFRRVTDYFSYAKLVGVTATHNRLDGKSLLDVLDSIAYVFELRDAIEQRYLVPIVYEIIDVKSVDLDAIKTRLGDYNVVELEKQLREKEALHAVAAPTIEKMEGRQTIVFCVSIAHAEDMVEVLNWYKPSSARVISSKQTEEEQQRLMADFENGRFQYFCCCDILTEGVDLPVCSGIVSAAPTMSAGKHNQRVGRGTRLLGGTYEESIANGKSDVYVLDFVGMAHGKKVPATLFDYIDGAKDVKVAEKVDRAARRSKVDPLKAIKIASEEVAREEQAKVLAKVKYTSKRYEVGFAILGIHPRPGRWGSAKVTPPQRSMLIAQGFTEADVNGMDKGQASEVIGAILRRRELGLCTYKQARKLVGYGFSPNISFEAATALLTLLQVNGWHATDDIRELAETAKEEAEIDLEVTPW